VSNTEEATGSDAAELLACMTGQDGELYEQRIRNQYRRKAQIVWGAVFGVVALVAAFAIVTLARMIDEEQQRIESYERII
jgi:hypothetical protein